ncbi:MAG: hypothetical protein JWN44_48 [Myxococcales bacterium]|nr:hypothetical protein [Myxococcales bacterium]
MKRPDKAHAIALAAFAWSCAATEDRRASGTSPSPVEEWGTPEIALTVSGWVGPPNRLIFVLYSSGRVLQPSEGDIRCENYQVTALTAAERNALIADLPLDRVGHVQLPRRVGDDGATACIKVWSANGARSDCLWGGFEDWTEGALLPAPRELEAIWKRLAHFSSPRARAWTPDHVDVRAEPWGWRQPAEKCGKPVASPWPKRWPQPGGKRITMPTWGWKFSLPATELSELRRIEAASRPNGCQQPVVLRGEYYELYFGAPLPHEDAWSRN